MKLYYYILSFIFLFTLCGNNIKAQDQSDENFILLIVPESDTVQTNTSKYRLSASTKPGSKVTINEKEYFVYPSGVFVDLLDLTIGENTFTIKSEHKDFLPLQKTFVIIREKPVETTPTDLFIIEDIMMQPSNDMWLDAGDLLTVRFKGTSGYRATFMDGIEMTELPVSQTGGIGGIYSGVYKVKETDYMIDKQIIFTLENPKGEKIIKESKAKVSFRGKDFPIVAITKGERPFLNHGLGQDRLGGAKLGFINDGIKLAINGKSGNQYRVALTDNYEAWIPEDFVELLPTGNPPPFSLTSSWNVYGDDKYDYVIVNLNEKLPYSSFQESEPSKIIVDLYGAVSNSNWVTKLNSAKGIRNVSYVQQSKNIFRINIELVSKQNWGYSIDYRGNNLRIKIKREPEELKLNKLTFILDAGHGGNNNGALGSTGLTEKEVNLSTVLYLKEILEDKGANVILTRDSDTFVPNGARVRQIIDSEANILISVHANSTGYTIHPDSIKGTSTYYKHIAFRPLSKFIYDELLKLNLEEFGNVGSFNFALNAPTEILNVLVELAFMSNPEDEMKLMDDDFKKLMAEKIVKGVENFLEYCKSE